MTKEEAIKYLQQLYPNGGHCWLNEQRMEAIGMAIQALQEEPVSVWHNMDEVPIKGEVIVVQTKDTFYGLSVQKGGTTYKNKNKDRYVKWAYASDLLNLSNVERTVKNWKEEPVAPKVLEDMLNAKTAAESLGISQEEHDRIVDELIYGKEPELVDDLSNKEKEPASEDLIEAANDYAHDLLHDDVFETFIAGAQWQKEHLWKPADGDDLPEIDREVIVLYQPYPCEGNEYAVSLAHRPKEYWDGKNMATGEVTRYYPERYDKGGWNIPDVKFWLDCNLPKK